MKRKILIGVLVVLVGIQFIRPAQVPQAAIDSKHIFNTMSVPTDIQNTLRQSCFDCHSDNVNYPWYSHIAPVSWLVAHDVNEGREHLNFSQWGTYTPDDQAEMLEEVSEEVNKGEMPMAIYVLMHSEAKLTDQQKQAIEKWATGSTNASENNGTEKEKDNDKD